MLVVYVVLYKWNLHQAYSLNNLVEASYISFAVIIVTKT